MKLPILRIKTALVFASIFLPLLLINSWTYLLLWTLVLIGSLVEYANLASGKVRLPSLYLFGSIPLILSAAHFVFSQSWLQAEYILSFAAMSAFLVLLLFWASLSSRLSFLYHLSTLIAMFFIGNTIALLLALRGLNPTGAWLVLYLVLLVWASDIGAFFAGKNLGKHKLIPSVSPNKTWEGLVGGITLSILVGLLIAKLSTVGSITDWIFLGLLAGVAGLLGDLIESKIKRLNHVKDSGKLLPGHGGILDRFDGLFGFIPFAFIYLYFVGIINL